MCNWTELHSPEEAFTSIILGKAGYTNKLLGFSAWRVREGFTIYVIVWGTVPLKEKCIVENNVYIFLEEDYISENQVYSLVEVVCLRAWLQCTAIFLGKLFLVLISLLP